MTTKFILLEHADGNDPKQLRIFETAEARIVATIEAIFGPDGKREDAENDLSTLGEDGRLDFEGDPSIEWIDAEVPQLDALSKPLAEALGPTIEVLIACKNNRFTQKMCDQELTRLRNLTQK